ncbi:glycosyltransferase family 1 protein [Terrabacter sp. 2RAF25]|uniref:glycosyltransferase family 1 protein n=1 Tax=Terrabacter sp. 2RAF25 TaxID=3232998 RepID=UPI003F956B57
MSPVIASIPSNHVYVRHLSAPDGDRSVTRLPDPKPRADVPDAQWWPPRMLEPGWVSSHADEFDLMHVHFGFDAVSPAELAELAAELRRHDRPLVLTVHDLRNPHHVEATLHDAQLGVLVTAADAVLTLTPGAAAEIRERWRREAVVVPHPHVVEQERAALPRQPHDGFVIGVHVKSLRAGMDPLPVIDEIVAALEALPAARLRVDAHTDVMTPGYDRHAVDVESHLRGLEAAGLVELHVHDYFTDDELWDYLQSLDVSVLPYRFGTHSGWLEACHDLGTVVAAPDCGYYADQRPCLTYAVPGAGREGPRPPTLADVLRTAYEERPQWQADPDERQRERIEIARVHEQVYANVLAAVPNRGAACTS